MDTGSLYMALSGSSTDELVRPELREQYHCGKAEYLSTSRYHDRTPGLFKKEFQGTRMIALTSKCYYAEDQETLKRKFSCKGVNKKQNELDWRRYWEALHGSIDVATNTGFRVWEQGVATYTQRKLGLSAYYDRRIVEEDGIHTRPLW